MTTRATPARKPATGLGWAALAVLMVLAGVAHTLVLWLHQGQDSQGLLGNTINLIPILLAATTVYLVSRQHRGVTHFAWCCIAVGLLLWALGDVVWAYLELVLRQEPFPSLADVFYVGYLLSLTTGLILMPHPPQRPLEAWKLGLDIATIVCAVAVFSWQTFLAETVLAYGSDAFAVALGVLYPATDLALLALLLLTALRQGALRGQHILLLLALCVLVAGDLWFNLASAAQSYSTGTPMDSLWGWAAALFGLAAVSSLPPFDRPLVGFSQRLMARVSGLGTFMPYAAILFIFYLALAHHHDHPLEVAGVHLGVAVVTLLVIVRQMLAFAENRQLTRELQRLNHDLELRVSERTRELEENRERLLAAEKLAALGRLTAGIAHEINTPLAGAMNHLMHARELGQEYRGSIGQPQVSESDHRQIAAELLGALENTNASLERMGEFIRRMRSQSRAPQDSFTRFDPAQVAQETLELLEPQAQAAGVRLELHTAPNLPALKGEAGRLSQVLTNLVQNAIHGCEETRDGRSGAVRLALAHTPKGLEVRVEDNGGGIAPEVLPKIFEPLFTTKPVGKGTGLGLPIVHDIVKGYFGGTIRLETALGRGTAFIVVLPWLPSQQDQP